MRTAIKVDIHTYATYVNCRTLDVKSQRDQVKSDIYIKLFMNIFSKYPKNNTEINIVSLKEIRYAKILPKQRQKKHILSAKVNFTG